MISQYDDIKISYILHKLIHQTERDFKNVSKSPSFFQKSQLTKKLYFARVRFARFLVVYRWSRQNPHTNKKDSKSNIFVWGKYFHIIKNQVKNFQHQMQHNFLNSRYQFMDQFNLSQLIQQSLIKSNIQKNMSQILCSFLGNFKAINHIQMIYVINKYVVINAHPLYHLILKIKEQSCYIMRLKFCWDRDFNFSPEYLKQLISQLEPLDLKRPNELHRIDSFIFSFLVISFFCKIVKKLTESAKSFDCQILREFNNSVLIVFPNTYQPFNQFILRINPKSNNIEIFSKTPLFYPPKDPLTINEQFEKLYADIFIPMETYNRIIDINENFNASELLSELRGLVFYTNVRRFWLFLKRAMRLAIFPQFQLFMICNSKSIYSISINFHDKLHLLLTITFSSIDGIPIFIPISSKINLGVKTMFPDAKKIFTSIFIQFIERIDFSHMFKPHALSLIRNFQLSDNLNYQINFSFSDHFFVEKRNAILFPSLKLRSVDTPENLNPRTILIKSLVKSKEQFPEFDKEVTHISITNKIFIVLLELERKLKLKGIITKRTLNTIYIPTMGCKFKIDLNEYWSICFEKPFTQFVSNGRVIITGNKLSLRFVDNILKMIDDWFSLGSLIFLFRHYLVYINDRKIYLKPFGYHVCIFYEPFYYDFYLDGHLTHYFRVIPFRYPSSYKRVMMYTPFSSFAQYLNSEEKLLAYFSCSIYYQLRLSQIFNSRKWKIVPFYGEDSFTLLYDNQYSMVFHRVRYDVHLVASIFMIGPSSLLLVPLSRIFQLHENKTPIISIKMTIFDMEKVKSEIEKYDDLIKAFKLMKIDHLFYNKGKVIGKGTRFYLVQAVLDCQGIMISSPSFPSLIQITTSIYNLQIDFESKKRIYNFIFEMLLFDDKYIVNTLSIFKELIKPHRIQKLNWEEMSNHMNINAKKFTLEFLIIEDQKKIFLIFDDPINESIVAVKDGKEKRFPSKKFDEIYTQLNPELPISDQFDV